MDAIMALDDLIDASDPDVCVFYFLAVLGLTSFICLQ